MDDATVAKVNCYINRTIQLSDLKKMHISFFGGEPLLQYFNVVKPISENFASLCRVYRKKGLISLTTNGILLTDDVISNLNSIFIPKSIQVPFDGSRDFYNKVKKIIMLTAAIILY